ncbi:MAG: phosphatidylinositol-specific phospholipase C1-like protein [Xenococcaceae cyanobacterium]
MKQGIFGFMVGGTIALGTALSAPLNAGIVDFEPQDLKLNQIQSIGTHNSYHIEPSESLKSLLLNGHWITRTLLKTIKYTHLPLQEQFELGIRQIELDVFADPVGGLYAEPLGPSSVLENGLPAGPNFDPTGIMKEPGLKVLHMQDIDFRSTCLTFIRCLEQIKAWSDANPNHIPIVVLVEAKDKTLPSLAYEKMRVEFTTPLKFDAAALDSIDEEIRSVFGEDQLLTPDDVRGTYATLNDAILNKGWPTLTESRGKIMFALDNGGRILDLYVQGYPSLEGRVMFTSSESGTDEAAFLKRNDPFDSEIPELVRQGYLVRTRADTETIEARLNDTRMRDAALTSGAHYVSTDYPLPNQYFSEYSVLFPEGTMIRCNPINSLESCSFRTADVPETSTVP